MTRSSLPSRPRIASAASLFIAEMYVRVICAPTRPRGTMERNARPGAGWGAACFILVHQSGARTVWVQLRRAPNVWRIGQPEWVPHYAAFRRVWIAAPAARHSPTVQGLGARQVFESRGLRGFPVPADHIRRIVQFSDPEFISLTQCDGWRNATVGTSRCACFIGVLIGGPGSHHTWSL